MFSWMEVLGQWKQGVVYPRWAALAHWGYGEARFLFYPPASWTLGAALGAVLPWKIVPAAYCWIVLTLAGVAMYRLTQEWLPAKDALFAAAFYALNPYHLLILYWRSAYAELLAAPLLPWLLLCLVRLYDSRHKDSRHEDPRLDKSCLRPTLCLSLTLAAVWLINIPAALMIHYSAAGLALLLAVTGSAIGGRFNHASIEQASPGPEQRPAPERMWGPCTRRFFFRTAMAILLGAGLASFYLLPAIYEQHWIDVSQVLSPGVRPQDNFLFTMTPDPDHNRFNLLVSTIALSEIAVLACVMWFSLRKRRFTRRISWILLAAWGTASALLMLSVSNLLWQHLPELRFVQLPFRWLLCMNAALAVLLAAATNRRTWTSRCLVSAGLLATLLFAGYRFQPPWWDTASDIREMSDAISDGSGYEGTDEYVPAGDDPYELNKDLPRISDTAGTPIQSKILAWGPTEKHFLVHISEPQSLELRLFNYPAWRVTVNGRATETQKTPVTGLMVIPVAAGDSDVYIYFRRTPDRMVGDIVSLISLAVFVVLWSKTRTKDDSPRSVVSVEARVPRRVLIATSNAGKLRDFVGAAAPFNVSVAGIPNFSSLTEVIEDGATFEENARKKAESYSLAAPGELVLADDSGLEIDALGGAPGVHSARYAAADLQKHVPESRYEAERNMDDEANNAKVLRKLTGVAKEKRTARFVCVLAVARDGQTLQTFRGTAEGIILDSPRGQHGFGYDPLFYFPQIGKTFAELTAEEKAVYSHRGAAFRAFLEWCR